LISDFQSQDHSQSNCGEGGRIDTKNSSSNNNNIKIRKREEQQQGGGNFFLLCDVLLFCPLRI
jgi:hypothetical protein